METATANPTIQLQRLQLAQTGFCILLLSSISLDFCGNTGRPLASAICSFVESGSAVRSSVDRAPMYFCPVGSCNFLSHICSASITAVGFSRCSSALVTNSTNKLAKHSFCTKTILLSCLVTLSCPQ